MSEAPNPLGLARGRCVCVLRGVIRLLTHFSRRKLMGLLLLGCLQTQLGSPRAIGCIAFQRSGQRSWQVTLGELSVLRRQLHSHLSKLPRSLGLDWFIDPAAVLNSYSAAKCWALLGRQPWALPSGSSQSRWGDSSEWSGLGCRGTETRETQSKCLTRPVVR